MEYLTYAIGICLASLFVCAGLALLWGKLFYDTKPTARPSASDDGEKVFSHARARAYEPPLAILSLLMAALAKVDGRIDRTEIDSIENAFRRLALTSKQRLFCIAMFREQLKAPLTLSQIISGGNRLEIESGFWQIIYAILWDIACADGVLKASERNFLQELAQALGTRLPPYTFERYYHERIPGSERKDSPKKSSLKLAYGLLKVSENATDEELKKAYRTRVKQLHPDILRAQGLPDPLLERATQLMAQLNSAWEQIKKARGLS